MKSITKSASAVFAVALMVMVAVVPMVGVYTSDKGVEAADSAIVLGTEMIYYGADATDISDLVYYGERISTIGAEWIQVCGGYYVNSLTGELLRYGDVATSVTSIPAGFNAPLIQITGMISADALINPVVISYSAKNANMGAASTYNVVYRAATNADTITGVAAGDLILVAGVGVTASTVATNDNAVIILDVSEEAIIALLTDITAMEMIMNIRLVNPIVAPGAFNLNLDPKDAVGDFTVKESISQGVKTQSINETVETVDAVVISGSVKDAGNVAINSVFDSNNFARGIKINYTVNNVAGTAIVDAEGKYAFNVVEGSTVVITGIAYYNGETVNTAYTFDEVKTGVYYDFGTVVISTSHDFVAKEKTAVVTVNSASTKPVTTATSITAGWYYQYKAAGDPPATNYTIATTLDEGQSGITVGKLQSLTAASGVVSAVQADGKAYYTYTVPTGTMKTTFGTEYANAMVAYVSTQGGIYTFDASAPIDTAAGESTLSARITASKDANLTNGTATITAKELVLTVAVTSANGTPAVGLTVTMDGWYYQYKAAEATTYTISTGVPTGITAGSVHAINSVTDSEGKAYFSYAKPTGTITIPGATEYACALVCHTATVATGYEFAAYSAPTNGASTLAALIAANDAMGDGQNGSCTLKSTTYTYKVSGNTTVSKATVTYSGGIADNGAAAAGNQNVTADKDGKYSFLVFKNASPAITPSKAGKTFSPATYQLSTMTADSTVDFTTVVETEYVDSTYEVGGLEPLDVVTFIYTVGDSTSAPTIMSVDVVADALGIATLVISAPVGSSILVSATCEGYEIPDFEDGYAATAISVDTLTVRFLNNAILGGGVPGEETADALPVVITLDYYYKNNSDEEYYGTATSNTDGFALIPISGIPVEFYFFSGIKVLNNFNEIDEAESSFIIGEYTEVSVFGTYVGPGGEFSTTGLVGFYAAPVNLGEAGLYAALAEAQAFEVAGGTSITFKAPTFNGYNFVGWMCNGVLDTNTTFTLTAAAGEDANNVIINALYEEIPVYEPQKETPKQGIDNTTLIIGIVAIVIALIAVAFVIISIKKKDA